MEKVVIRGKCIKHYATHCRPNCIEKRKESKKSAEIAPESERLDQYSQTPGSKSTL